MKLSICITKDPNEYLVSDYVLREAAGMPLISVNIKDSGGLASHSNAVTAAIERSLKNSTYADLIFVARYISLGNTMTAYLIILTSCLGMALFTVTRLYLRVCLRLCGECFRYSDSQNTNVSRTPHYYQHLQAHNCCTCSGSSCGRREVIQVHLPDVSM